MFLLRPDRRNWIKHESREKGWNKRALHDAPNFLTPPLHTHTFSVRFRTNTPCREASTPSDMHIPAVSEQILPLHRSSASLLICKLGPRHAYPGKQCAICRCWICGSPMVVADHYRLNLRTV